MPPCAVPVWDRVGYSFEMTAVLTSPAASRAARRPAPPAPTITASYTCVVVIRSAELRRVEGEHDHRAQHEQREPHDPEGPVPGQPRSRTPHVVEDDGPHPHDAVKEPQREQHPVPRPPEGTGPPLR